MKLLNAVQIREWDKYTIQHEPITSLNLMERAANACLHWLLENKDNQSYCIFCGMGNNGGDGLAIARLLSEKGKKIIVYILNTSSFGSADFNENIDRLKRCHSVSIYFINAKEDFPTFVEEVILLDALFGTGLNRRLDGLTAALVEFINESRNEVVSIDLPSGLLCDASSLDFPVINAAHTLTFQCLKLALLIPENEIYFGQVHVLEIGLHPSYLQTIKSNFYLVDKKYIDTIYKPRKAFSHKGNFGHALVIAGSYGKMGAAVLSTKACLRSGAGLVTCHIPKCGLDILQISAPEAMCKVDDDERVITKIGYDICTFSAVGVGPGIDQQNITADMLLNLLKNYSKPLVIDADALNILSAHKDWLPLIPANSILTPHPKEFERLFGNSLNDFEKIETATRQAQQLKIIIILKGHRTFIATPKGNGYFNTNGNAGMATGGSGDVLTGILTGLLAQGYLPEQAAILGVYLHGLAGDKAAQKHGIEGMISGDIIEDIYYSYP